MHIEISTDANITGDTRLRDMVTKVLQTELAHLEPRLTRVEVHLADENAAKGGADDIRCTMEARPEGMQPQTVVHHAADTTAATRGGAKKLRALLERTFDRRDTRR